MLSKNIMENLELSGILSTFAETKPRLFLLKLAMTKIIKHIKIAGVQFAVNPAHKRDMPMSEEEKQRTIDFLSRLDEKKPLVSVSRERGNRFDDDAFVVRWISQKCGYVRDKEEYKSVAHAAIEASGKSYFKARVCEVVVADNGYFMVEVVLTHEPERLPMVDRWAQWNINVPAMELSENERMLQDALMMLEDMDALDADEIQQYCEIIVRHGRHALWCEARRGIEDVISRLEAVPNMHDMAEELDHLLTGMCNGRREQERRDEWWPEVQNSEEASDVVRQWRHEKGTDVREASKMELTGWLMEIEKQLSEIPTIANPETEDEILLMTRSYYAMVPECKWRRILAAMIIRRQLRAWLGLPMAGLAGVEHVMQQEELRFIGEMVNYSQTLPTYDEVRVLQTFIYRHAPSLPPKVKEVVDGMTARFGERDALLREQTDAMKEIASRPTFNEYTAVKHVENEILNVEAGGKGVEKHVG